MFMSAEQISRRITDIFKTLFKKKKLGQFMSKGPLLGSFSITKYYHSILGWGLNSGPHLPLEPHPQFIIYFNN
jgi:SNF family Na+-dependent transporter